MAETTWYKVTRWNDGAEPVRVVKETDKTITIIFVWNGKENERRIAKESDSDRYFPTEAAAISYILTRQKAKVNNLMSELDVESKKLLDLEAKYGKAP